jgi:HAE1 family hydrophobic/amphiphilic exporter-1
VQTTTEEGSPEVEVVVDRVRASMFNLTTSAIISQIKDQLEGKNAGQFDYRGEIDDITIRIPDINLSEFSGIKIRSGNNEYRLDEVAALKTSLSPREILHRNQVRVVRIDAQLQKDIPLDKVSKEIESSIASVGISTDYRVKITGEEEKRNESMKSLGFALLLSILLVYMVMASQFESLIHPFVILFTVPMAVSGSIFTFLIIGKPLNIMALIGIIMLVGIAVNNAIILVDRINQLKAAGMERRQAIIMAAGQRIRPILMTSLTTILALIPLTIGFGDSAALRAPMAWAVIGGLATSTILSLIVIPCFYDLFDRVTTLFRKN